MIPLDLKIWNNIFKCWCFSSNFTFQIR